MVIYQMHFYNKKCVNTGMKIPVYLYTNLFEVILDLDNNNRINRIMYQRNLTLQKGVKNKVQFQFKNSDQKLLRIFGKQFVLVLIDQTTQRQVMEKTVTILDDNTTLALKGLGEVVFTESDLEQCIATYYTFAIKMQDTDGSYVATYANTYYNAGATVEVKNQIYPVLLPSQTVTDFQMYYNTDSTSQQYEYYSGNLYAYPEFKSNTALHTVATYMTNFKGTVLVEGTLENSPMSFGSYAIINTKTYNHFSGIDYVNFNGVFSKVRVRFIPAKNPVTQNNGNGEIAYRGTVDKVLYRS